MNENYYCVCSCVMDDEYFACYEQAVEYAKHLAVSTQCGNAVYLCDRLIGTCEWDGYELLGGGGYREKYVWRDYVPTESEAAQMTYPDMFTAE